MEKDPLEKESPRFNWDHGPVDHADIACLGGGRRYSRLDNTGNIQGARILGGRRGMLLNSCSILRYIQDCGDLFEGVTK